MNTILKTFLLAGTLAGCIASGGVGYQATVGPPPPVYVEPAPPPPQQEVYVEAQPAVVEVQYVEPTSYVYVNPNVQVIEDYDYPVFFSGGLYWRNDGGIWYSSSYHDRGWATSVEVPLYVRNIDRPQQYVHYRGNVNARYGEPGYRAPQPPRVSHPVPPPRYVEQPGHPVMPTHNAQPVSTGPGVRPQGTPPPGPPMHTGPMPGQPATQPGQPPMHTGPMPGSQQPGQPPMHTGPMPGSQQPGQPPMHTGTVPGSQPGQPPMHTGQLPGQQQPQPTPIHPAGTPPPGPPMHEHPPGANPAPVQPPMHTAPPPPPMHTAPPPPMHTAPPPPMHTAPPPAAHPAPPPPAPHPTTTKKR